ncbi:MAG TPA: hypothetical protein VMZ25_05680 [Terriglobales bacterium]|nr:hypothetical protein [Terriglobales bacterium]
MRLTIDNFGGPGPLDYTPWVEESSLKIVRELNGGERMECSLAFDANSVTTPAAGARIVLVREDGHKLFTGYLAESPAMEYLGWQHSGAVYRHSVLADSDDVLFERQRLPQRPAFLQRTAGEIARQLAADGGGGLATAGVQEVETLPQFATTSQLSWRDHMQRLATRTRCCFRAFDGDIRFAPMGGITHTLNEADADFSPRRLSISSPERAINDLILLGRYEPRAYVKDYFIGDGLNPDFNLSQTPFLRRSSTLLEEEFQGDALDPRIWSAQDAIGVFSVTDGRLQMNGGSGSDGAAWVKAIELVEVGGALNLQHGEVEFTSPSSGVIGGLYNGSILRGDCVAGFSVANIGGSSTIRAMVNGAETGATITIVAGRRYAMSTRIYATEPYRRQQVFHSSASVAGGGLGGVVVASAARVVLEVHEMDPANPATLGAASVVLFDGLLTSLPSHCTYAIANAGELHGNIRFVRLLRIVGVEVRSTIPAQAARTRLVGSLAEGAECVLTVSGQLVFFSPFVPVPNETMVARYRATGRAIARLIDAASIAGLATPNDNGRRTAIVRIVEPAARNSADCTVAAEAILEDATQPAWQGTYECWSDFLPSGIASDPLPGESVSVISPSRDADFTATIREVEIQVRDLAEDRSIYKLKFANDAAAPLAFEAEKGILREPLENVVAAAENLADLPNAEITGITSTTITVDCGVAPPVGGGVEVRRTDFAWSAETDRNLIGRFTTQVFTLPRLARIQTYCIRQFDTATPHRYSRNATALHVDYPF